MENWKDLYLELATELNTIPEINWVDLWHNQVNFLDTEHPFSSPAIFLSFRSLGVEDAHKFTQNVNTQVDVYLFYETFADTAMGSANQESALDFLDTFTTINKLLHGSHGDNYGEMRRIAFTPVDTGSAHNLYRASYVCNVNDESAYKAGEDIVDENGDPVAETEWQEYSLGDD